MIIHKQVRSTINYPCQPRYVELWDACFGSRAFQVSGPVFPSKKPSVKALVSKRATEFSAVPINKYTRKLINYVDGNGAKGKPMLQHWLYSLEEITLFHPYLKTSSVPYSKWGHNENLSQQCEASTHHVNLSATPAAQAPFLSVPETMCFRCPL